MGDLANLREYLIQKSNISFVPIQVIEQNIKELNLFLNGIINYNDNLELSSYEELFSKYQFSFDYDSLKEILFLKQAIINSNMLDTPQYKLLISDIDNLKNEIQKHIKQQEEEIIISKNKIIEGNRFKKYLKYIEDNSINTLTDSELKDLIYFISELELDNSYKMDVIYHLTLAVYKERKNSKNDLEINSEVINELSTVIDENIKRVNDNLEVTNDDAYDEKFISLNEEIFAEILKIVDNLSNFFEHETVFENKKIDYNERIALYSSTGVNSISKYQWSLIYSDLCCNLIPRYKNKQDVSEIEKIFGFIIEKYNQYESINEEISKENFALINEYLSQLNAVNVEKIIDLYMILKTYQEQGIECDDLGKEMHIDIPYSNNEILYYGKIIELQKKYQDYLNYRSEEVKNRFDSVLGIVLEYIDLTKEEIDEILKEINILEEKIDKDSILEDEDIIKDNQYQLTNEEPVNLLVFMDINDNHILSAYCQNTECNDRDIHDVINLLYSKYYMLHDYAGHSFGNQGDMRPLVDTQKHKNLEKNSMYRARKNCTRVVYCHVHVSEKNCQIIRSYYPKFSGVLFLITGIYHKANDKKVYIDETEKLLKRYQENLDYIRQLFDNDLENEKDIETALNLIGQSLSQYNDVCSFLKNKGESK